MKKVIVPIIFLFVAAKSYAQITVDTVKVMSYNAANIGEYGGSGCPTLTPAIKEGYLRTILKFTAPDIVGLVKMAASDCTFYTDSLLTTVFDSVCNTCYGFGTCTNSSGYYKENMLYYNSNKFGFIGTTVIYSSDPNISDIDLHKLYYKSPTLSITKDTVFLNIILVHDESGSSDSSQRGKEIGGAMSWLDANVTQPGNYIFMGDFNVQTATEKCFTDMINPTNANVKFYDPVNELDSWSKHPSSYASLLTQSTRTTDPGDCAATGGMNNRFDMILCTDAIMSGTDSLMYVDSSYAILGQDGNHVNKALIDSPTNKSVPPNILTALYQMSEHLPVMLKLAIGGGNATTTNIKRITTNQQLNLKYNSIVLNELDIISYNSINEQQQNGIIEIFDLEGRLIEMTPFDFTQPNKISLSYLTQGIYIFSVTQNYKPIFTGKLVKL